jgi:hypothetical protein
MAPEKAMDDFHHKIQHYLEQYEPINPKQEPSLRHIKIMNEGMCFDPTSHHFLPLKGGRGNKQKTNCFN